MKITIVTINYNNKVGLKKTIDSILSQTYKDFEWIVIDGGSSDGSKELLETYKDYFSYCCSEKDTGVYNAQNKGISKATGEYVNCMNSGDVFANEHTLQEAIQKHFVADIVYGDWVRCEPKGLNYMKAPTKMTKMFLFTDNICHQAMFVKTHLLQKKGFDESLKIFSDWLRWRELLCEGATFQYLGMPICIYDSGGLSDTPSAQNTKERQMLHDLIPADLVDEVEEHAKLKEKLWKYENNKFLLDTYHLVFERPLYCHFIKCNLWMMKLLKKFVDKLKI